MGTTPGWGLEHRASNPVSVKNVTAIETPTNVKLLRPYVPVGTKRTSMKAYNKCKHAFRSSCTLDAYVTQFDEATPSLPDAGQNHNMIN
jgi:hypothetical protein